jgi:hypothetical protein
MQDTAQVQETTQTQTTTPTEPTSCPAPPPHPAVSDLVARYKKTWETLQKIQNVLKERRAKVDSALITSLTVTLAALYGIGTDTIEKLLQAHVGEVMKYFEKEKVAWSSETERNARLTYLLYLAEQARQGKPLNNLPITAQGAAKDDALAKLKSYIDSHLKNELTETENFWWKMKNNIFALAQAISALPQLEEWVKNCTLITPEMFAKAGIPAPGKDPVTIDPVKFAEYLTKLDEYLKKYEDSLAKAAKKILDE